MFLTRTPILIIARQISLDAQKIIKKIAALAASEITA